MSQLKNAIAQLLRQPLPMDRVDWVGDEVAHMSLHTRRSRMFSSGLGWEHLPFLVGYVYLLMWCFDTAGEPYAARLRELEEAGKWPVEDTSDDAEHGLSLPNPHLPGFFPLLFLAAVCFSHVLLSLMQVWFIKLMVAIQYRPCATLATATHIQVVPTSIRGKTELVPLQRNALPDGSTGPLFFLFQRRKFVLDTSDTEHVLFRMVEAEIKHPIHEYVSSRGYTTDTALQAASERFGKNIFSVPSPTFSEMYKEQLLKPLTVFQLFCVVLWMLDEYWKYSVFTGVMILTFEAVTVFQRFRNLKTLRGMSNASDDMYIYRNSAWTQLSTEDIIPGDVVSVKRSDLGQSIIPCDCLLLRGSAVVNEASLTGESQPQMKESVSMADSDVLKEALDMKGAHKVHVLYGGTMVLQCSEYKDKSELDTGVAPSPDKGCVAIALQTGFSSSQGQLMRMIEFSNQSVSSYNYDALGLISILLVFALLSSGYVLKKGLEDKNRSHFELLLHCIMIVTSVIPPELPMQTAMAVNSVIMALVKLHIFCTEPDRIPRAGKIDTCLFDKTGTLTADELTAVGVVSAEGNKSTDKGAKMVVPMMQAPIRTAIVLAGCHSLVVVDDKVMGDPVEEAALKAIAFEFDPKHDRTRPKANTHEMRLWPKQATSKDLCIDVLHRNHFAAKLQRMSVIANVQYTEHESHLVSLVKGSPEKIRTLLKQVPAWYDATYMNMARNGMRVLALASKKLSLPRGESLHQQRRHWAESELQFEGFVAFRCLVRKDSPALITQLKESSHHVAMVTGDATLTAIHVAAEVNIVPSDTDTVLLLKQTDDTLAWVSARDDSYVAPFDATRIKQLSHDYHLCTSETSLRAALAESEAVWDFVDCFSVFARMTPAMKEKLIMELKSREHVCLMCGDGANDVGALKQSDIGVALLSGFGSMNVDKKSTKSSTENTAVVGTGIIAQVTREDLDKDTIAHLRSRLEEMGVDYASCRQKNELIDLVLETQKKRKAAKNAVKRPLTAEEKRQQTLRKQAELEEDVRRRQAAGESWPRMNAMAAFVKREAAEARQLAASKRGKNKVLEKYMDDMDDGDVPMVKLGDASIASPFTSKTPSIKATVDIIRQGRCALVTTIQMYQILALSCLISAYSLSVLYLDGIKYGDRQMTASGMLMTVSFMALSRATPLEKLCKVRPLKSIFHPALFLSLVGQFTLHLVSMVYLTMIAKAETPDWSPAIGGEFKPNLLNTVVFLVSTVQSVAVYAVNYKGRPFMIGMADNPGLLYSLGACGIGVFLAATESVPVFNKFLELVPFPNAAFSKSVFAILCIDVLGSFLWDRTMLALFAYPIFKESLDSISKKDIRKFAKMGVIMAVLFHFFMPSEDDFMKLAEEGLVDWTQ